MMEAENLRHRHPCLRDGVTPAGRDDVHLGMELAGNEQKRQHMIDTTIGHYKIESKLGEGGMGVVYKATDTKLNRPVALKFLPAHVSEAEKDKERFVQEAQAAASLSHANICTIHGIDEHEGKQFIVMEYVDGQTLQEKKQNLPLKQALEIGIQIADGLAVAHDKGIVHRDIKPENIMIKKDGTVQIMDFGLAKLRGATRLTKEGSTVGTVGYMSPEQVQGLDVDHRTDIFSLGVLLYEMIAGQSPFKGVHETAITYEIVNVDPPPIGSFKPEIDADLDAIVLDCVAKDPPDRYQSAAEVGRNLRRVKRESSRSRVSRITGSRPAYVPQTTEQAQNLPAEAKDTRRSGILPWAVAITSTLAALLIAAIALFTGESEVLEERVTILTPEDVSYNRANGGSSTLSPDGSMIAFVGRDSTSQEHLYLRHLNDLSPRLLPGTDEAYYPFWSPDNKWIGFLLRDRVMKINIAGGAPQTIAEIHDGRGASWGPDGTVLVGQRLLGIVRVNANGGDITPVTTVDTAAGEVNHRWPSFLPDGEHFLFTAVKRNSEDQIAVGSVSSDETTSLLALTSNAVFSDGYLFYVREGWITAHPFDPDNLEFMGDPYTIAQDVTFAANFSKGDFSVSSEGDVFYTSRRFISQGRSVRFVDRSGDPVPGIDIEGSIGQVRLSPAGDRLVTSELRDGDIDLWIYDLKRNLRSRLTFERGNDGYPVWPSDGTSIVYSSGGGDNPGLYQKDIRGTGVRKLIHTSDSYMRAYSISRRGDKIAYTKKKEGGLDDVYVLTLGESGEPVQVTRGVFDYDYPVISPDGRWVAYTSNETSSFQIYVEPFPPTGARWQVTSDEGGAEYAVWNPNGRELFYLSGNSSINVAPIEVQGDALMPGQTKKLFDARVFRGGNEPFDVSPDGQRLVYIGWPETSETDEPMTLVRNWKRPGEE